MNKISILFVPLFAFSTIQSYSQPTLGWARNMGGTGDDTGNSIAIDDAGNVYTVGDFVGTADFDPGPNIYSLTSSGASDVFISKLDMDGNFVWAKKIGGSDIDHCYSVALDGLGNVYFVGAFRNVVDFDPGPNAFNLSTWGDYEAFLCTLDANGNFRWAKRLGGTGWDNAFSLAVDGLRCVYITGIFTGTVDFDPGLNVFNLTSVGYNDIYILKLNRLGNFIWAKAVGGVGTDFSYSLALDYWGNVFYTGRFYGTVDFDPGPGTSILSAGNYNGMFISKLDTYGDFRWAKKISRGGTGWGVATDASGNVYTTGSFSSPTDFDPGVDTFFLGLIDHSTNCYLLKLDGDGNFVWAKEIAGDNDDEGRSVVVDAFSNIYVTGYFKSNSIDLDPGPDTTLLIGNGYYGEIFIVKFDSTGNAIWGEAFGTYNARGKTITVDALGNVYATGSFNGVGNFDPWQGAGSLNSRGLADVAVWKISTNPVGIGEPQNQSPLRIYPNPTSGWVTVEIPLPSQIYLFNALGEIAYSAETTQPISYFDLSGLPNGLYYLNVKNAEGSASQKLMIAR